MRSVYIILITIILSFSCSHLEAQDNPFMQMAGKPYREYYTELEKQAYHYLDRREPEEAARIAAQMREVSKQSGEKKWNLEADYFECLYNFHHALWLRWEIMRELEGAKGEKLIPCLLPTLQRAEKTGEKELSIRIYHKIMNVYFNHIRNYELGFRYCLILDKLLSGITASDFPPKPAYYLEIERWYNRFGEYETARRLCYKVIEDPVAAYNASHSLEGSLNDLGAIYRNYYRDFEKSDSCFNAILKIQIPDTADAETRRAREREYDLWSYIAKGQIGSNYYLRGDYDNAIPLLAYSVEKIAAHNQYNYSFAAGKALTLSNIHIKQRQFPEAKKYLDSAYVYISRAPEDGLWQTYYPVAARYYGATGDAKHAIAAMDSVLSAQSKYDEDFNLRKLYLAEQQLQQEKLDAEQLRSETYRRNFLITSVLTSIVILLAALLFYFYRQKRKAYRVLTERIRQWAQTAAERAPLYLSQPEIIDAEYTEVVESISRPNEKIAGKIDNDIFEKLQHLFLTKHIYRNPDISLEIVAQYLDINRSYLSQAVNRCTGKNFNTYINEYRVKEAVRIISSKAYETYSVEGIAFEVGFNSRKTFYEAFKKITGLSPSEFRNNLPKE